MEERVEATTGDELEPTGRHAFGVVGGGTERDVEGRVVDQGDAGAGDVLALAADEQRPALGDRFTRERAAQQREHRTGHERIEDHRQPGRRDLLRAEEPHRAVGGVTRRFVRVEIGEGTPRREAAPCLGGGALPRHGEGRTRGDGPARAHLDAERVGHRALDRGVAVRRRLDTAHTRVGALRRRLELERERNLGFGRYREHVVAPQVEGWRDDPVEVGGRGEDVALVRRTERGVVTRLGDGLGDDLGIERTGPRVALAGIDDDAHTDTFDLGDGQRLDLAAEDLHVDVARTQCVRLELLTCTRVAGDAARQTEQIDVSHPRYRRR